MAPDVLSVARAIFESSDHHDDFGIDVLNAEFEEGLVAGFAYAFVDFLADFCDGFFDAAWVDSAVGDESFERLCCDFAADGIECRDDDGFGRVVDDEIDAGCGFNASDVAPFATDDAAFDFVVVEMGG